MSTPSAIRTYFFTIDLSRSDFFIHSELVGPSFRWLNSWDNILRKTGRHCIPYKYHLSFLKLNFDFFLLLYLFFYNSTNRIVIMLNNVLSEPLLFSLVSSSYKFKRQSFSSNSTSTIRLSKHSCTTRDTVLKSTILNPPHNLTKSHSGYSRLSYGMRVELLIGAIRLNLFKYFQAIRKGIIFRLYKV